MVNNNTDLYGQVLVLNWCGRNLRWPGDVGQSFCLF